jgi:hypothetical protein
LPSDVLETIAATRHNEISHSPASSGWWLAAGRRLTASLAAFVSTICPNLKEVL